MEEYRSGKGMSFFFFLGCQLRPFQDPLHPGKFKEIQI